MENIYCMWTVNLVLLVNSLLINNVIFLNVNYRAMNDKLSVEAQTTATESAFSNRIVERHNLLMSETFWRLFSFVKCKPEVALLLAVSAKTLLKNFGGIAPNQLVFGHNPNSPSVLEDKLPVLENSTSCDFTQPKYECYLKMLTTFFAAEFSKKTSQALRCKEGSYSDVVYVNGDWVYVVKNN